MNRISICLCSLLLLACSVAPARAQQPLAVSTDAAVPLVVNYNGVLGDANSKPVTGTVGVTFYLYKDSLGGAPLWVETQNVKADKAGRYTVGLGSATSNGLPGAVFASGEARWLGVQVQGQDEQPRVLLMSVPYALKALDAETIGGKPASAFALASPATSGTTASGGSVATQGRGSNVVAPPISGSGKPGYIPEWLSPTKLGNSQLFQSNEKNVGISTATPAQKFEVDLGNILVRGSDNFTTGGDTAFVYVGDTNHPIEAIHSNPQTNSGGLTIGTYKAPQLIYLQDGTGNVGIGMGTKSPAATLDVKGTVNASSGFNLGAKAFAFGSYQDQNALLGFAGKTGMVGQGNTGLGYEALHSNVGDIFGDGSNNTALGSYALFKNDSTDQQGDEATDNTAVGAGALYDNLTGSNNTALGSSALAQNTYGIENTATGYGALYQNTTGNSNTAVGWFALDRNSGNYNAGLGYEAAVEGGNYSTAIGAYSYTTQNFTLVLGCVVGFNGCPHVVNVGIGTTNPDSLLTVNGSADKPGGGSWGTYSDRRLKTLDGNFSSGLSQIMKIHPVRYRYKKENALGIQDSQEHVGLVAQEVQSAIPEAVTTNSKGYLLVNNDPIIWTMLNAIKEQQEQIRKQDKQIAMQQVRIARLTSNVNAIRTALRANVRANSVVRATQIQGPMVHQ